MSETLKVTRDDTVALLQAIGFKMAHKWETPRLVGKLLNIGDIVDDSASLEDAVEATLISVQEAVENKVGIEVVED